jgi:hypothetical protein
MTKSIAYGLLIIYTLAMLKPIVPVAKDILAHTFWKVHHITTAHHHHGEQHVHIESNKAAQTDQKKSASLKYEKAVSVHVYVNCYTVFSQLFLFEPIADFYLENATMRSKVILTPPPKFS